MEALPNLICGKIAVGRNYNLPPDKQTPYGTGMCGGVILHGRENLEKAYYGIHT